MDRVKQTGETHPRGVAKILRRDCEIAGFIAVYLSIAAGSVVQAAPDDFCQGSQCVGAATEAAAQATPSDVPLPPPRPADLRAPATAPVSPESAGPPAADATCGPLMASGHIVGQAMPPVVGAEACGIASPVRLEAIILANGSQVAISPPVVMRCSLAASVADWVRDDIAPAIAGDGDRLVKIDGVGAYECRSRDNIVGAKLSEHAKGNAMDLHALVTQRGQIYTVKPLGGAEPAGRGPLMTLMRDTACKRFMTVLGPGSDSFHAEHLHVDLEERKHDFRLCQWNLP